MSKLRLSTTELQDSFSPVNPLTKEEYDETVIHYRYMPIEDVQEIMSRCYTLGPRQTLQLNSGLAYRTIAAEAILDWEGMEYENGEILKCNEESKLAIPGWIRDQVLSHSRALDQIESIGRKSLEKKRGESQDLENPPEAGLDTSGSPDTPENTSSPESNLGDGVAASAKP